MAARRRRSEGPVEPVEALPRRLLARDRLRLMSERDSELERLPRREHNRFLSEFYAAHPGWPHVDSKCPCRDCFAAS